MKIEPLYNGRATARDGFPHADRCTRSLSILTYASSRSSLESEAPHDHTLRNRPVAAGSRRRRPVDRMSITISLNGPYLVNGGVPLTQEVITPVGGHREYRTARAFPHQETYALCRCGQTSTPPFCDGSHVAAGFHGAETASRASFEERADIYPGPGVTLYDDNRCAFARFCHREDGDV